MTDTKKSCNNCETRNKCDIFIFSNYRGACCEHTVNTEAEKDIAALDIGIKAIERNKAAIAECKGEIPYLEECIKRNGARDNNTYADGCRNAYESIIKILEGVNE